MKHLRVDMKKILVSTDFSPHALAACDAAVSLSRRTGASVHLCHVVEVPDAADMQDSISRHKASGSETMTSADERLRNIVKSESYRDTGVTCSIDFGIPYKCICDKAEKESYDLIVTGSRGMGRLETIVFGSTAQKIVSHAHCPVLITHDNTTCFAPSNIVFGTGAPALQVCGEEMLRLFASVYNAMVHFVRVSTKTHFETSRQSKALMAALGDTIGLQQYTISCYNDESIEAGLRHFAEDYGADLIFMPTHGRTGLRHLLRKSVAATVAKTSDIPVLTCRTADG
ncbi:MAG: universal stress protein [Chlorobi bacterium]|nr:universal stress protein [Chlorobiota bacterium]